MEIPETRQDRLSLKSPMPPIISLDYETFYIEKKYSVKDLGNWRYVHDERFDPYLLTVCDGEQTWAGNPRDLNWNALPENALYLAHNAGFERAVTGALIEKGIAPAWIADAHWQCTANLSACIADARSLEAAIWVLEKRRLSKEIRGDMSGKTFKDAEQAGIAGKLVEYAAGDARECRDLWVKYSPRWSSFEQELSELTMRQCSRGVRINVPLLHEYRERLQTVIFNLERSLPWTESGAKPTSPIAIAAECRKVGIPAPPTKTDDEEGFNIWEITYGPQFAWVYGAGQWRSLNKLLTSLETIQERLRPDDTIDFSLLYFGGHCFTGDHEVLTPDGWVRLDKWAGGKIIQWKGGSLLFDDAIANKLDGAGEDLLHLNTGHVELIATQGHWLATLNKRGEFVKRQAEEVRHVRFQLPLSAPFVSGSLTLPAWKIQLIAAVQADGHYLSDCRSIRFRLSRERKILRLRSLLDESGLDWKEVRYPSEPGVCVFIIRQYPDWLENRKEWTSELLTWSLVSLQTLRSELVHWDGHQCGPDSVEYVTTSENNASWIATIAHLTGWAASITKKERTAKGWNSAFRVFLRPSVATGIKPGDWKNLGPAGTVYCPTAKHGVCLFRYNGKIFLSFQTGRWSGGGSGFNLQNLRKTPLYLKDGRLVSPPLNPSVEIMKQWVAACTDYELDIRKLLIPRDGKKFIIPDLSQIEPRVLAWLTHNAKLLAMLAGGMSIYEAHARTSMNWTAGKLKKENPELYNMAKIQVLGLGYGAAWKKLIVIAAGYGVLLNEAQSRQIVADFREQNQPIVQLWYQLDDLFKKSVRSDFEMGLPSGRSLIYRDVQHDQKMKKDAEGKWKMTDVYTALIGNRRFEWYGGKLTENLVQAIARDIFGEHLLELERNVGDVIFHVHDEAIVEADLDVNKEDAEHVMAKAPEWIDDLPVASEAKEASHYLK
jgi:hypothetical protein